MNIMFGANIKVCYGLSESNLYKNQVGKVGTRIQPRPPFCSTNPAALGPFVHGGCLAASFPVRKGGAVTQAEIHKVNNLLLS